jgi:hypothetical protein
MTPNESPKGRFVFLELAVIGLVAQLVVLGFFLADYGLDLGEMGDQLVASPMATLALVDLGMSALVFLVWMPREAARAGLPWWPYALATLGGLCFALPLFLYARSRAAVSAPSSSTTSPSSLTSAASS